MANEENRCILVIVKNSKDTKQVNATKLKLWDLIQNDPELKEDVMCISTAFLDSEPDEEDKQ